MFIAYIAAYHTYLHISVKAFIQIFIGTSLLFWQSITPHGHLEEMTVVSSSSYFYGWSQPDLTLHS